MLRREEAEVRLKAFAGDPARPGGGIGRFRRALAGPLAVRLEHWASTWDTDATGLAEQLDALGERQLARTFGAVSPALGDALARWWIWAQAGPYQHGWARRGFRSSVPADSRAARMEMLRGLIRLSWSWPQDAAWFATWVSHVPEHDGLGGLLASEITSGRTDIADTLVASALGHHPVSGITRSGIRGLLASDRPEHWEQVAGLLRNAGRQEGLRSVILESVDLAHPDAFRRILDVVVEENLTRFAATVRAAGVWFGEELTVRTAGQLTAVVAELARALADPAAPVPGTPAETFIRLTAVALHDARRAIPYAAEMLRSPDADVRRPAARLLAELGLVAARDALRPALADPDLAVYATAVSAWPTSPFSRDLDARLDDDAVAVLMNRVATLGAPRKIDTGLIGQRELGIGAAHAADVVLAHRTVAAAPPEALAAASPDGRHSAAHRLAAAPAANRAALFALLADPSSSVRSQVYPALAALPEITPDEADLLHAALRRKASDLRQQALKLLLHQTRAAIARSVTALSAGTAEQAAAAVELAARAGLPAPEGTTPPTVLSVPASVRYRPEDRTPAVRPTTPPEGHFDRFHPGCLRVVTSLKAWLDEHADVEVETSQGVSLLANLRWLPYATPGNPLPLPEIFEPWWERIGPTLTDGGVELLLLRLAQPVFGWPWAVSAAGRVIGAAAQQPPGSTLMDQLVAARARHEFRPSWTDVALDAAEALHAALPLDQLHGPAKTMARLGRRVRQDRWGNEEGFDARKAFPDPAAQLKLDTLTRAQLDRLWRLARFVDEPEGTFDDFDGPRVPHTRVTGMGRPEPVQVPDQPWRLSPSEELLCRAVDAGVASRGDLLHALWTGRSDARGSVGSWERTVTLHELSSRRPKDWAASAAVQEVVDEFRQAAIAGELARGELAGPLAPFARKLRSASGIAGVTAVLTALRNRPFARGYSWTDSRESSLSHLVRIHQPAPGETADELSAALTAAGVSTKRAVEFGVYAPQWARLVEGHLGWPGYESAVWWVHAHTKDDSWVVDQEIREEWASAVSQRTPLDSVDLVRGAADVEWFRRMIDELGLERFRQVLAAAKYASSAGGHKRAELFASALLGQVDETALLERIRGKRHQDSVRALGLLPLDGRHDPALLARYQLLAGFVATDRTSGSQRRASEATAVAIGMENLARSAGYRDPGRLTWAMEAEAVRDLAAGPITASDADLSVTLSLDAAGAPQVHVERAGRVLKSIPSAAGKVPEIAELKERVTALRKQATRMRRSLEASCVTGERFEVDELADLLRHPVLAPMLRTLVLVSDEGIAGFPADDADVLIGPARERRPLDGSPVRIAHPVDLLAGGEWPDLQHELFAAQRKQPFRQLFRELYVPIASETGDGPSSRRYAGHQVESRRAAGIFSSRGWVADFEVGFGRTFHAEKITAWCSLLGGAGTAAEVEDATIEEVTFVRAGSWETIPVPDVPPRLFSETMRDLDLVVSVAHAGGVDPETTESSTEMRGRLVEETAALLGLDNVEVTDHHARIRGTLGSYSVQLGSGVVHRIPGNAICIIPVSAQHRGRIFLPFTDDDPRTAEVISKVLLLARDDRIQDPTILEQLT